jgi:hypothetical protein
VAAKPRREFAARIADEGCFDRFAGLAAERKNRRGSRKVADVQPVDMALPL